MLLFYGSFPKFTRSIINHVKLKTVTWQKPPVPFSITKTVFVIRRTSKAGISLYFAELKNLRRFGYEILGCDFQSVSAFFFPILFLYLENFYWLQLKSFHLNYCLCLLTQYFHRLLLAHRLNTIDYYCLNQGHVSSFMVKIKQ